MQNIPGNNRMRVRQALSRRESFKTHGSLSARTVYPMEYVGSGRLIDTDLLQFRTAFHDGLGYVVISYDTPIAWVTTAGSVYYVTQRFSVTTTKHQNMIAGTL